MNYLKQQEAKLEVQTMVFMPMFIRKIAIFHLKRQVIVYRGRTAVFE